MDVEEINESLRDAGPVSVIRWALELAKTPVLTTNFRPYEAAILHAVTQQQSDVPVIWCDTGYNTRRTYEHAVRTIAGLNLNIDVFVPEYSVGYRDVLMGIPHHDSDLHKEFTRQVKLEPFYRAMAKYSPDVWFTNIRKDQTEFRSGLDIVSETQDGILRVSPFFNWNDDQLQQYLEEHGLESEENYFDPTKVLENRECGLHTQ